MFDPITATALVRARQADIVRNLDHPRRTARRLAREACLAREPETAAEPRRPVIATRLLAIGPRRVQRCA